MSFSVSLPYPPSVNTYWRHARGRTYISAQGKKYREVVVAQLEGTDPIEGRLKVELFIYPPDRRRRDIDNVLKALLDALEAGGAYYDDAQIKILHAEKADYQTGISGVDVFIERIA